MQLLDFPDEVLCKIFEYLSLFDALNAFLNINERLNRILTSFKHQIDLTRLSYGQFIHYVEIILPILNKNHELKMIKLGDRRTPGQIELFNKLISSPTTFENYKHVENVVFQSIKIDELNDFINEYLLKLSNLVSLSIEIDYISDKDYPILAKLIINLFNNLTNLIKLSIEIPSGLSCSSLSSSSQIQFSSLIYLKINIKIPSDLLILIQCIPNIEHLIVAIFWWSSQDQRTVKILKDIQLNSAQTTLLSKLHKFSLSINSIISFHFEEFQQILALILSPSTTISFKFCISNDFKPNDSLSNLINGQQWENFLKLYNVLNNFQLSFRLMNETDTFPIESFQSKFFQMKNWFFSYLKFPFKNTSIFYSIPYKFKSFDIPVDKEILTNSLPLNYASTLLIYSLNDQTIDFNDFISKYFPFVEKLLLDQLDFKEINANPLNQSSLQTVQIKNAPHIHLRNIYHLFPLINTLCISCFSIIDENHMPR